jgi:hypothetical protein
LQRVEEAAIKVGARLKAERKTLKSVQRAARTARNKALRSKKALDKNAAKRARAAVIRIDARLTRIRAQARSAKSRLVSVQGNERLKTRIASIKSALDAQNKAGMAAIEGKVEATLERLASSKRVAHAKAEMARAKKRTRVALAKIRASEKAHAAARAAAERVAARKATAKRRRKSR